VKGELPVPAGRVLFKITDVEARKHYHFDFLNWLLGEILGCIWKTTAEGFICTHGALIPAEVQLNGAVRYNPVKMERVCDVDIEDIKYLRAEVRQAHREIKNATRKAD
jgi:hypothetical protein